MAVTRTNRATKDADEQPDTQFYLPARADTSTDPGLVERVLTAVFRRRGSVPFFTRTADN